jgi:hypothetical protein
MLTSSLARRVVGSMCRRVVASSVGRAASIRPSVVAVVARCALHCSAERRSDSTTAEAHRPALSTFSAEEDELRSMVAAFAKQTIQPRVAKMDEDGSEHSLAGSGRSRAEDRMQRSEDDMLLR